MKFVRCVVHNTTYKQLVSIIYIQTNKTIQYDDKKIYNIYISQNPIIPKVQHQDHVASSNNIVNIPKHPSSNYEAHPGSRQTVQNTIH